MEFSSFSLNSLSWTAAVHVSNGLTLIFSMMGVLNFAHASFICWGLLRLPADGLSGPAGAGARPSGRRHAGALTERWGLRTVHKYGHVAELFTSACST